MIRLSLPVSSRNFAVGAAAVVMSALLGYMVVGAPEIILTVVIASVIGGAILLSPRIGILAALATVLLGQTLRLSILGTPVVATDLVVALSVVAWFIERALTRRALVTNPLTLPLFVLIGILILSLLAASVGTEGEALMGGSLYLIRLVSYLAFLWVVVDEVGRSRSHAPWSRYLWLLLGVGILLALVGFLQLWVLPDFSRYAVYGWDPHFKRLLSTWFDPNFIGGFFLFLSAMSLGMLLNLPLRKQRTTATGENKPRTAHRHRWFLIGASFVLIAGLIFTFSRSSYLGFLVAVLILGMVRSRLLVVAVVSLGLLGVVTVPRLQERLAGILDDPAVRARIESWQESITILRDAPLLGVGYNLLRDARFERGFITSKETHAASGFDSSLLTIAATSGVVGGSAFLWLLATILFSAWKVWRTRTLEPLLRGYGLGLAAATAGLFIHSFFVNSLLYAHLMLVIWMSYGILFAWQRNTLTTT